MVAQAAALTVFVLAGNTLLRPLVNAINRIPIDERSSEATYYFKLAVTPRRCLIARPSGRAAGGREYPVAEVNIRRHGAICRRSSPRWFRTAIDPNESIAWWSISSASPASPRHLGSLHQGLALDFARLIRVLRGGNNPAPSVDIANNFAVNDMSPDHRKRHYRKIFSFAAALVTTGLVIAGLSLAELARAIRSIWRRQPSRCNRRRARNQSPLHRPSR